MATNLHSQVKELSEKAKGKLQVSLNDLDGKISGIEKVSPGSKSKSLAQVNSSFTTLFNSLEESDMPVTSQLNNAVKETSAQLEKLEGTWAQIKTIDLPKINEAIKSASIGSPIKVIS